MPDVAASTPAPTNSKDSRASRILARSLFRDMRQNGYNCQQILALATELIGLVTTDVKGECDPDLMPRAPSAKNLRRVG
jgi:hypothetical protein